MTSVLHLKGLVKPSLMLSFQAYSMFVVIFAFLFVYFSYLILGRYLAMLSSVLFRETACSDAKVNNAETLFFRLKKYKREISF